MKKREEKKGIYKIECIVSGRIYVGSTCVEFKKRWKKHKQRLRNNYHENDYLQKAWNKYGEKNFIFSIIEELYNDDEIKAREEYWLKIYFNKGKDYCFNLSDKACGGNTLLTDEIKQRQSDNIKKSYTPELLERRRDFANDRIDDFLKSIANVKSTKKWKENHRAGVIALAKRESWIEKNKALAAAKGVQVETDRGEIFPSLSEAARQTGAIQANIRKCIKGEIHTSMGRKWYYVR